MKLKKKKHELKTLADIDEYLGSARKIYIAEDYTFKDYKEFIKYLVTERPATYYKNGNIHCPKKRNRSISDIALLCKVYFNTPFKDVILELERLTMKHFYCPTVRKNVFNGEKVLSSEYWHPTLTEFGGMRYKTLIEMCS